MSYIPTAATPDESSFTEGTTPIVPVGGEFNDASATVAAGKVAGLRITEKRAAHVNLRNETGTEVGTAANPLEVTIATTVSVADAALEGVVSGGKLLVSDAATAALAALITSGKLPVTDALLDAIIASGALKTADQNLATAISSGKVSVSDTALDAIISAGKLPMQSYAAGSDDVWTRVRIPTLSFFVGLTVTTAASTVITAPAGQYFYLTGFDLSATLASAGYLVLQEEMGGTAVQNAWVAQFPAGYQHIISPSGFSFVAQDTGSTLICQSSFSTPLSVFVNVYYGFTSSRS